MAVAFAVIFSGLLIALSIVFIGAIAAGAFSTLEGLFHMLYAIRSTQLRIDLVDLGYEIPDWLKEEEDDEGEDSENDSDAKLKVVRLLDKRKD